MHNFTINRRTGDPSTIQIDCSSIYSLAREGYTYGNFTQATVTLRGQKLSIHPIKTTAVIRINSTAVTLYEAGTETKYDRGTKFTAYKKVSSGGTVYYNKGTKTTYYNKGASKTYRNPGSGTKYDRGGEVSVTPIGEQYNFIYGPIYNANGGLIGSRYYSTSSAGRTVLYAPGTAVTYYRGNGGSFTPQGSEVTVTTQGEAVSVTPIGSTTIRVGAAAAAYPGNGGSFTVQGATQAAYKKLTSGGTLYYQENTAVDCYTEGSTDSTTYYKKNNS